MVVQLVGGRGRMGATERLGRAACEGDEKRLEFIEEMTANADEVQGRVLTEILCRNAATEYLSRHGMAGESCRVAFKERVPIVTYEDLLPDIQRIADGDRSSILSSHPISEFLTSSGTSAGERKLMPTIDEEMDRRQLLYSLLMPVMNMFVRRKNVLLSIESDKTDEAELQAAVERAAKVIGPLGANVVEYTSQPCTKEIPGHYVIYWELMMVRGGGGEMPEPEVMERCCYEMEEAMNTVYRQSRVADGSIGPLEIRVVRPGTFEELMDYAISRGASINQYKLSRCVTYTPIIDLLDSRVMSAHFSPKPPSWTPHRMTR